VTGTATARYGTVIVGGGHAGVQAVAALRAGGYDAGVALLSAEVVLPYDRPSLSKGYLEGELEFDEFLLRSSDFWDSPGFDIVHGATVVAVRPAERVVETADGRRYEYDSLIWAAGGEARKLAIPGAELAGVHTVRRFDDAERLRADAEGARSAVIIGGGYIGLETAASLTKRGHSVTVVEVVDRLLARVTSPVVADYFVQRHRAAGVDFRLGAGVEEIVGEAGHATAVRLSSGETLPADVVVVGVGLTPNLAVIAEAGATIGNGVETDEFCRTSLPDVYAIGDCVNFPIPLYDGQRVRLESVQNAVDQAKTVAAAILGDPQPYDPKPWFWSHQFEEKLQTVGLLTGYDELVVRGHPDERRFSVVYLKDSRIVAVDAVNLVKDFAHGKFIVGKVYDGSRKALADSSVGLKDLVLAKASV
jgi:3-phenylpropionate/trans-cinnamate dioxygenase ferredoxin reductase component